MSRLIYRSFIFKLLNRRGRVNLENTELNSFVILFHYMPPTAKRTISSTMYISITFLSAVQV